MSRCVKLCAGACVSVFSVASQANAAIVCEGNFQIVDGEAISTPYCQDENLASSGRKFGYRASGSDIRKYPDVKREVCTSAASTNETACADYLDD